MSQSPEDTNASQNYVYGWVAISQFMSQGLSFSGREKNCCFLNTGETQFADVSTVSGLAYPDDGRAIGVVDWDADGRPDLWMANRTGPQLRLMHNRSDASQHWISLSLQGTTCNRDAIGARVELYVAGSESPQIATLRAGESFLSQSSKWLHFGLGKADEIRKVIVHWPGGEEQVLKDLTIDTRYRIVQGNPAATKVTRAKNGGQGIQLTASELPTEVESTGPAAVRLAGPLPLPAIEFEQANGKRNRLFNDHWTLVNLWSSTCAPCLKELKEFAEKQQRIEQVGLRMVALNVDQDVDATPREKGKRLLADMSWPFEAGYADAKVLDALDIAQRIAVSQRLQMPVPTSFLMNDRNELCAIYKGPVSVAELLTDLDALRPTDGSSGNSLEFGTPFAGRWAKTPAVAGSTFMELVFEYLNAGYLDTAAELLPRLSVAVKQANSAAVTTSLATAHLNLGAQYASAGRDGDAIKSFQQVVKIQPAHAKAHYALAMLFKKMRKDSEVFQHLRAAVQADPQLMEAQLDLGMAYAGLGQAQSALRHLSRAHELKPKSIAPINVMARILALHPDPKIKNLKRAQSLAVLAVDLSSGQDAQSLDTLANVWIASGDRARALDALGRALKLAIASKNQRLTRVLEQRIQSLRK